MSWNDTFNEALAKLIERHEGYDGKTVKVAEILSYQEDTYDSGFCETCSYTETVIDVYYKDDAGDTQKYRYFGKFAYLIQDLTSEDN